MSESTSSNSDQIKRDPEWRARSDCFNDFSKFNTGGSFKCHQREGKKYEKKLSTQTTIENKKRVFAPRKISFENGENLK